MRTDDLLAVACIALGGIGSTAATAALLPTSEPDAAVAPAPQRHGQSMLRHLSTSDRIVGYAIIRDVNRMTADAHLPGIEDWPPPGADTESSHGSR